MRLLVPLLIFAVAGPPAARAEAGPPAGAGCLYGTVTTEDGEAVTGFLRTESWDTFWDDVFTAVRSESPWAGQVDPEELAKERRAEYFREEGLVARLAYVLGGGDKRGNDQRQFLCRYGQIARISLDRDGAVVETTDGGRHPVGRRSRDLAGELTVAAAESLVLDFDDLREIVFFQAPAGALPPWRRLSGTVTTTAGTLVGFIRWDLSESVDLDLLDGEDASGDHDLPMGLIASLAKERDGTRVVLRDGRSLLLTGTNDVNADNRGVAVEVADLGRVTVRWRDFVRADFDLPGASGPARGDFPAGGELTGVVTDKDGRRLAGRLVWDLDEGWTWDLLNGSQGGTEYDLPMAAIARIEPEGDGARVTLRAGTVLLLDEGTDVTAANQGVLVMADGTTVRVPWRRLAVAEFGD
ncbi:MAG: hypothetical protein IH621_06055 [Krumholzibacteria bacterium]|nr:hypothetical protein [Candidatus Krumholzibacteria bacterium]